MFARIAARTGVQLPSPPGFARDEVASEACRGVASAKPDFVVLQRERRELRPGKPACRGVAFGETGPFHDFHLRLHLAKRSRS
jgi:hypothetical protein